MTSDRFPVNLSRLLAWSALVAVVLPASATAAEQERLGRMFFTPAQRASLDVARSQRARTAVGTESAEDAAPAVQTITYGGLIQRSDGRTTVWLNNQAVHDDNPAGAGAVVSRVRPDGSITLQAPQSARSVNLKPGQTVELQSGTIEEGYSRRPQSVPEPKPKPGAKPAADTAKGKPSPAEASRAEPERDERQQQIIEDAVSRAIVDTINARPAAPPPPPAAPTR